MFVSEISLWGAAIVACGHSVACSRLFRGQYIGGSGSAGLYKTQMI